MLLSLAATCADTGLHNRSKPIFDRFHRTTDRTTERIHPKMNIKTLRRFVTLTTLLAAIAAAPVGAQPRTRNFSRWGGRTRITESASPAAAAAAAEASIPSKGPFTGTLIEFDPPGASTVPAPICEPFYCGTLPSAINDSGVIVGSYMDSNIVSHGFLRLPDGHFVTFDAPGGGQGAGLFQGTTGYGINNLGEVAGYVEDSSNVTHGFIRHADGSFTTFDAPGAGTGTYQGTYAFNINLRGETAGSYVDANNGSHGFVRSPAGKFTSFDEPGSVQIYPFSLDDNGVIFGEFQDAQGIWHCFIRDQNGTMTTVDAPGAGTVYNTGVTGTLPGTMNIQGELTGTMVDSTNLAHGFVRSRDGQFTFFEAPGSPTVPVPNFPAGTGGYAINSSGVVTGVFGDANKVWHTYVRSPGGSFTVIDAPHAGNGVRQGTEVLSINHFGAITGSYIDSQQLFHGYVWIP
jgi:hypothetical protein